MCITRPITTNNPVAWFVSQSVMRLRCAKAVKRIEVRFGAETLGKPRHFVLDGSIPTTREEGE